MLFLYQDWALGLLALKLWMRAMTAGGALGLVPEQAAQPAQPGSWRARLETLGRTPLRQLPLRWTVTAVIWPLLQVCALFLSSCFLLAGSKILNSGLLCEPSVLFPIECLPDAAIPLPLPQISPARRAIHDIYLAVAPIRCYIARIWTQE